MSEKESAGLYDVAVIGGGVVGCAVLRELSRYRLKVVLLEKNSDLAEGVSKGNSGVIHAGFNVRPGTLKARLNAAALRTVYDLAATLHVPHRKTGKLVVSPDDAGRRASRGASDLGREKRHARPRDRGRIRDPERSSRKPGDKWALYSPWTGIISPYEFTIALAESAFRNGAEVWLGRMVTAVEACPDRFILSTPAGPVSARWVVNSAGLFSDDVAAMAGSATARVYGYKGEYLILDKSAGEILRIPIYPVPPSDGSLGIHITPGMDGNVILGPSGAYVDDKEDTASTRQVMRLS